MDMTYNEWLAVVTTKIIELGLPMPELEILELEHMDSMESGRLVEDFVKEYAASF